MEQPTPRPSRSRYHEFANRGRAGFRPSFLTTATAKAVTGLAAAGFLTFGGAAVATAATGSPSPAVWGSTVTRAVTTCRGTLARGEPGVGPCVSGVAQQDGRRRQGSAATASAAPTSAPTAKPATAASPASDPHPTGKPSTPPTPAATAHSGGQPTPAAPAAHSGGQPSAAVPAAPRGAPAGVPANPPTGRPASSPTGAPVTRPTPHSHP